MGEQLHEGDFLVSQDSQSVGLLSVRTLAASRVDVAIVLDTAASAPVPAYERARQFALSLLAQLPPGVRAAVVAGGSQPRVLSGVTADRERAVAAVRQASRSGGHALVDGVAVAGDLLATRSGRLRHVVVVSTGRDDGSERDLSRVRSTLDENGIGLQAVAVRGQLEPSWGDQCPPAVSGGEVRGAASLVAWRVSAAYELVAARIDDTSPVTVRVRSGDVDARAQADLPPVDTAVRGLRLERSQPEEPGSGMIIWVLAGLVVLGLAAALWVYRPVPSWGRARAARFQERWFADRRVIVLPEDPHRPDPLADPPHRRTD
jgi:hypothetical protein